MELNKIKHKALKRAKDVFESIFDVEMDAYEYEEYKEGNITEFREKKYLSDVKCAVSYRDKAISRSKAGSDGDIYMGISREIKLYLPIEVKLKKGSKIVITSNGHKVSYKNSGEPAIYETHQEIGIKLWDRWG